MATPLPSTPPGPTTAAEAGGQPRHAPAPPRRIDSSDLFGPDRQLEITHGSAVYRLSLTSLGKLILTK